MHPAEVLGESDIELRGAIAQDGGVLAEEAVGEERGETGALGGDASASAKRRAV